MTIIVRKQYTFSTLVVTSFFIEQVWIRTVGLKYEVVHAQLRNMHHIYFLRAFFCLGSYLRHEHRPAQADLRAGGGAQEEGQIEPHCLQSHSPTHHW